VLDPYAFQNMFALFGFGGAPLYLNSNGVSHCFNLNGAPDPRVQGFETVFRLYKETIFKIKLSGPTFFKGILKSLLEFVKSTLSQQMYHVMLILTDGDIHDKQETTDLIIELSK